MRRSHLARVGAAMRSDVPVKLLKRPEVEMMTALSRSALYEAMARDDFPRPIRIGPRGVRWIAAEIQDWIALRPRAGSDRLA